MGTCISTFNVPIEKTTSNAVVNEDDTCFVCCQVPDCVIPLHCGHNIHAKCLAQWWSMNPTAGLCCPMCRTRTYHCYMEITKDKQIPVGYYRQDCNSEPQIIFRNNTIHEETKYVSIKDIDARNLALAGILYYQSKELETNIIKNSTTQN